MSCHLPTIEHILGETGELFQRDDSAVIQNGLSVKETEHLMLDRFDHQRVDVALPVIAGREGQLQPLVVACERPWLEIGIGGDVERHVPEFVDDAVVDQHVLRRRSVV